MALADRLALLGISLPPPGPDRGGRLASALLTKASQSIQLSHDTESTALITLARQVGLYIPACSQDVQGCLQTALGVQLAQEAANPAGMALATFYADLWTLLKEAGVEIPDEEQEAVSDELSSSGWTITRDGPAFRAEPDSEGGGVMLDWNAAKYARTKSAGSPQGTWVKYNGPLGGEGWKNVSTGQVLYGAANPNEQQGDLHIRMEEARKRRNTERKQRSEKHGAQKVRTEPTIPVPPALKQREQAQKVLLALQAAHGDEAMERAQELSSLVSNAIKKLPPEKAELKQALQQKLAVLQAVQTPQEKAMQAKLREEPQFPEKASTIPQSPFLPKRGTS